MKIMKKKSAHPKRYRNWMKKNPKTRKVHSTIESSKEKDYDFSFMTENNNEKGSE